VEPKPAQEHWYRVAICLHEFGQRLVAPSLQILEIVRVIGAKPHHHGKVADHRGVPTPLHSFKSDKPHPPSLCTWYGANGYLNFDCITPAARRGGRAASRRAARIAAGTVETLELGQFEIEKPKPSIGSLKSWFRCRLILLKIRGFSADFNNRNNTKY